MLRRTVIAWRVGLFPVQLDPPTLMHSAMFRRVIEERGLSKLIIVPHTKFAVTIQHSLHLAALSALSVRDDPMLDIDFGALERPSPQLPRIGQLAAALQHDVELVHWYHDRHAVLNFQAADDLLSKVPVTLLRIPGVGDTKDLRSHPFRDRLTETLGQRLTVLDVEHRRGTETRRLLFEGEQDPTTIVSLPVLKYMNSHHLYRDFRKLNRYHRGAYQTHRATSRGHTYDFAPQVATDGSIPRLEVVYDEHNKTAQELAHRLSDFIVRPGEQPDLIVPIGGDGFMMQTIRRHWQRFIPFFGVNAGHVGYLLNDAAHLEELMSSPLKLYHCPMLYAVAQRDTTTQTTTGAPVEMPAFTADKQQVVVPGSATSKHDKAPPPPEKAQEIEQLAFNDAWMERATGQTALLNVSVNGMRRLTRARGDGVLVSTPAGSTAYAIALGASPLPIGATMLQLVGSNIVSPSRWKPVHLNHDVIVEIEAQDTWKRPCKAYVDGVDVGYVSKLTVRNSRVAGVQLAFSRSCDLQAKLYKLQFPES